MERIQFSEQLDLSRIVQGFWRLTKWGMSTDELAAFMEQCVELGVTTFDTAEVYGGTACESQMGLVFEKYPALRRSIQLVSKMGIYRAETPGGSAGYYDTSYERVLQSCQEALQRLHCEVIDLYLIHREDPCFDPYETADALKEIKRRGYVKEVGVSNFDPFKFDALNRAMDGALVTNQIEWNPVCFEHFRSGMMDCLTRDRIHPMIWSPLAGGRIFTGTEEIYTRARAKIEEIAKRYDVEPAIVIYAWILYHPVKALPISGSNKIERLKLAVDALSLPLKRHEWYEIYTASGQQVLR